MTSNLTRRLLALGAIAAVGGGCASHTTKATGSGTAVRTQSSASLPPESIGPQRGTILTTVPSGCMAVPAGRDVLAECASGTTVEDAFIQKQVLSLPLDVVQAEQPVMPVAWGEGHVLIYAVDTSKLSPLQTSQDGTPAWYDVNVTAGTYHRLAGVSGVIGTTPTTAVVLDASMDVKGLSPNDSTAWTYPDNQAGRFYLAGDTVVVPSSGSTFAYLDAATGTPKASVSLPSGGWAATEVKGKTIFVTYDDGGTLGAVKADGTTIWTLPAGTAGIDEVFFGVVPVGGDGEVVAASVSAETDPNSSPQTTTLQVAGLRLSDGKTLWTQGFQCVGWPTVEAGAEVSVINCDSGESVVLDS